MITLASDLEAFAIDVAARIRREEAILVRSATRALHRFGQEGWYEPLIKHAEALARATYRRESGKPTSRDFRRALADFREQLADTLEQTGDPADSRIGIEDQARAIAGSIATAAISLGYETAAASEPDVERLGKVWVTMEDERVRPTHAAAHGQVVHIGEKFTVGGAELDRPGDMSAPIEEWINCRCFIGIDFFTFDALAAAGEKEDIMATNEPEGLIDVAETVPWHGVLAPEDVLSGDGRKFAKDTLRWRDLPLPLSWQKINDEGHKGSVVVGRIDDIWREEGLIKANGMMLATPEADEVIGVMADGGLRGVSVDVDDAEMELQDEDGNGMTLSDAMESDKKMMQVLTSGRICGATMCPIPAFQEAFVMLGPWADPTEEQPTEEVAASGGWGAPSDELIMTIDEETGFAIDEGPWDGSAGKYTDEQWFRATLIHTNGDSRVKSDNKLPVYTPNGALSRAGVHAAASRINQVDAPANLVAAARRKLRGLYRTLGEEAPESLAAATEDIEEFVKTEDGPGWLTHPVDTDRLRDYWTHGRGAAKIGWGTPGDFNRCRVNLAKYVKPQYLSGYCANRHYDALGFWPGDHARMVRGGRHSLEGGQSLHLALVASGEKPPVDWFEDPHFTGPSPLCITEDGRIFGHVAAWGTCHIGFDGVCITPPENFTDYAYFKTGLVVCADGTQVKVGQITMDTGHAPQNMGARPAAAHYDNTGAVVADVAVGEDEYGIWYSGRMRESATQEQIDALRAAGHVSGDWREIGGNLEMIAALAVNVGGFPIPRTQIAASGGRQTALIASGIVTHREPVTTKTLKQIVSEAVSEKISTMQRREAMRALASKTKRDPKSKMRELAQGRTK